MSLAKSHPISAKRAFFKTVAAGSVLAATSFAGLRKSSQLRADSAPTQNTGAGVAPPERNFVLVDKVPDADHFIHDPGMTILPGGRLLAAIPCWLRQGSLSGKGTTVRMWLSEDRGDSWQKIAELPYPGEHGESHGHAHPDGRNGLGRSGEEHANAG